MNGERKVKLPFFVSIQKYFIMKSEEMQLFSTIYVTYLCNLYLHKVIQKGFFERVFPKTPESPGISQLPAHIPVISVRRKLCRRFIVTADFIINRSHQLPGGRIAVVGINLVNPLRLTHF